MLKILQIDRSDETQSSLYQSIVEKLLQVINAFVKGGHTAYVKKSKMLMFNSTEYNTAIDFIKTVASIEIILDLFLLYKKAEITKKNNAKNNRTPIPYYLIDCFARYECKNRNPSLITSNLLSNEDIKPIIVLYTRVSDAYTREYLKKNNVDYNKMIKQPIDYELIDSLRETFIGID